MTWCPECNWNVEPSKASEPEIGALDRVERRIAVAAGERLHRDLHGKPAPTTGGAASFAAIAIVVGVHLVTVAVLVAAVWLLVAGWPNPFAIIFGLLLLGLAWLLRPRFGRLHPDVTVVDRASAPSLWGLIDEVSKAVDAPKVDTLVLTADYNALYGRVGLRRKAVLGIGVPLWSALAPDEKVALLGHELGHAVNGDARRGLLVSSALNALAEWYLALSPDSSTVDTTTWLGTIVSKVLFAPVRWLIHGVYVLEVKLLAHAGQRAEYLADALAARVAGSSAEIRSEDRLLAGTSVMNALRRAAVRRDPTDMREIVRSRVREMPDLEWERLRRVSQTRSHQVDASHPPTALRRDLIASRPDEPGVVRLDGERAAKIDAELTPYVAPLQRQLYDAFTFVR